MTTSERETEATEMDSWDDMTDEEYDAEVEMFAEMLRQSPGAVTR